MIELMTKIKKAHKTGILSSSDVMVISASLVHSNDNPSHLLDTVTALLEAQRVIPKEAEHVQG